MIYFVDEDFGQMRPYRAELAFRGYEVAAIETADTAYEILAAVDSAELVIIDIMLAVSDFESDMFSRKRTGDYLFTGLILLEELCKANPQIFPTRAVLLTNTVRASVKAKAKAWHDERHVPLLWKNEMVTAFEFGEAISDILGQPPRKQTEH